MKVMVTGGAGFIGSHIVESLIQHGLSVVVIDDLSTGSRDFVHSDAAFYQTNIVDHELDKIFEHERPEALIHHAAQVSVQGSVNDPMFDAQTNILGTVHILECCRKYGVRKIIYASSCATYGNPELDLIPETHPIQPLSPYGISKATPELYLKLYHNLYSIQYVILRYANVYGPRQGISGEGAVVPSFISRLLQHQSPIIYGDGAQTRDFVYVKDVAAANLAALNTDVSDIMNIGSGSSVSISNLYERVTREIGSDLLPEYRAARPGDVRHSLLDSHRAAEQLAWRPVYSLEQGLKETVSYYRQLVL